jgi:hypothetical protein
MAQGEDPEFKPQYCKKIKNLHMGAIWNWKMNGRHKSSGKSMCKCPVVGGN